MGSSVGKEDYTIHEEGSRAFSMSLAVFWVPGLPSQGHMPGLTESWNNRSWHRAWLTTFPCVNSSSVYPDPTDSAESHSKCCQRQLTSHISSLHMIVFGLDTSPWCNQLGPSFQGWLHSGNTLATLCRKELVWATLFRKEATGMAQTLGTSLSFSKMFYVVWPNTANPDKKVRRDMHYE